MTEEKDAQPVSSEPTVSKEQLAEDRKYYREIDKVRVAESTLKSLLGEMKRLIPAEQDLRQECVYVIRKFLDMKPEEEK